MSLIRSRSTLVLIFLGILIGALIVYYLLTRPGTPDPRFEQFVALHCPDLNGENYCLRRRRDRRTDGVIATRNDASGLARIEGHTYLVVHDAKDKPSHATEPRLSIVHPVGDLFGTAADYGLETHPLAEVDQGTVGTPNWLPQQVTWHGGQPNDLEGICRLDDRNFLVNESGSFRRLADPVGADGFPPRLHGNIYHVALTATAGAFGSAQAVGTTNANLRLPYLSFDDNRFPNIPHIDPDERIQHSRENYEGLACVSIGENRHLVIIGERGTEDSKNGGSLLGSIYWGIYDRNTNSITWERDSADNLLSIRNIRGPQLQTPQLSFTRVHAPATQGDARGHVRDGDWRDITTLHILEMHSPDRTTYEIWSAAAYDYGKNASNDDIGPFHSLAYRLGYVCLGDEDHPLGACEDGVGPHPVVLDEDERNVVMVSISRKIEGMASPRWAEGTEPRDPDDRRNEFFDLEPIVSITTDDEDLGSTWWPLVDYRDNPQLSP